MSARLLLLATPAFAMGCISHSMHSPRPVAEGEVQLGGHVGSAVGIASDDDSEATAISGVTLTGTGRIGLGSGLEVGIDAGTLGAEAAIKYGFRDHDDPLQVSLLASVGAYGWAIFDGSVGALAGYTFGEVVTPYVGYRQHVYILGAAYWTYAVIGGIELELGHGVGLLLEANLAELVNIDVDDEEGEDATFALVSFSGGLTYTF